MPQIVENAFTEWRFEHTEFFNAYILSDLQLKAIQTEISIAAQQRSMMAVNPDRPVDIYVREQEYMRGKIEALQHLIAMSDRAKELQRETIAKELNERQLREQGSNISTAFGPLIEPDSVPDEPINNETTEV